MSPLVGSRGKRCVQRSAQAVPHILHNVRAHLRSHSAALLPYTHPWPIPWRRLHIYLVLCVRVLAHLGFELPGLTSA